MNVYTKQQRIAKIAKQHRGEPPEKARLIYFGKPQSNVEKPSMRGSFDFLGFTHFWAKSHRGYWAVRRKTTSKKLREKLKNLNEWCRRNRELPLNLQHEKLCQKLKGHYAYYGITGNARSLGIYLHYLRRIWKKWLNRRSWRGHKLTWERFKEMLEHSFPLPPPRIVHSYLKRSESII